MANQDPNESYELLTLVAEHYTRSNVIFTLKNDLKREEGVATQLQHTILKHLQTLQKKSLAVYIEGTGNVMIYHCDTHGVEPQLRVEGPIELLG